MDEIIQLDLDDEIQSFLNSILTDASFSGVRSGDVLSREIDLTNLEIPDVEEGSTSLLDFTNLDLEMEYVPVALSDPAGPTPSYKPTPITGVLPAPVVSPDPVAVEVGSAENSSTPSRPALNLKTISASDWEGGILYDSTAKEIERTRTTISVAAFGVIVHAPTSKVLKYRRWKSWAPNGKILLRWDPALQLKTAKLIVKKHRG